jgi:hypothetical protein
MAAISASAAVDVFDAAVVDAGMVVALAAVGLNRTKLFTVVADHVQDSVAVTACLVVAAASAVSCG